MTGMLLHVPLKDIMEAAHNRLLDATADGELLEDVKSESVIKGDRARPHPELPAVWVFGGAASADSTSHGLAEIWSYPITVAGLVKNEDPLVGYDEATDLAARAVQVLLTKERRLGLKFVADVTAINFDPSSSQNSDDKRSLFWASGDINVRFRRLEP